MEPLRLNCEGIRKNCISRRLPLRILVGVRFKTMRSLANAVSEGFIWAVGITRPRPGREHAAALYITLLLIGIVIVAACIFLLLVGHIG